MASLFIAQECRRAPIYSTFSVSRLRSDNHLAPVTMNRAALQSGIEQQLLHEHFSADPGAIGQNMAVDGRSCSISGVMPEGFEFPTRDASFWVALQPAPDMETRGADFLTVIARMKPGTALPRARSKMKILSRNCLGHSTKPFATAAELSWQTSTVPIEGGSDTLRNIFRLRSDLLCQEPPRVSSGWPNVTFKDGLFGNGYSPPN